MKSLTRFFGIFGLILIIFGIIALLIDLLQMKGAAYSKFSMIHLIAGALFLILYIILHLDSIKDLFTSRSTYHNTNTVIYGVLFLGVVIFVNVILINIPTTNKSWDLTEEKVFSLSDQTTKILKNLKQEVEIIAFFGAGAKEREMLNDTLARFQNYTVKLKGSIHDADENPQLAKEYEATNGVVVVKSGNNKTKIGGLEEQDVTNALIMVSKTDEKAIYFSMGHEEGDMTNEEDKGYFYIKKYVENEGYQTKDINLTLEASIPKNCNVLVMMGPKSKFTDIEIQKVDDYLNRGGHAFIMVDPVFTFDKSGLRDTGLNQLFVKWGFEVRNDIIFFEQPIPEAFQKLFGRQLMPQAIADTYETHDITKDFKKRTTYPYARSLNKLAATPEGVTITEIIKLNDVSYWGETNIPGITERNIAVEESDNKAPLTIALVAEKPVADTVTEKINAKTQLVVFGNSAFAENQNIKDSNAPDMFLNCLNYLAGESEKISVRPKKIRTSKLSWTEEESAIIFYASVLTLPELILLIGLAIWQWRRKK